MRDLAVPLAQKRRSSLAMYTHRIGLANIASSIVDSSEIIFHVIFAPLV